MMFVFLSAPVCEGVDVSGKRASNRASARPGGGGHHTALQLSGGLHPGGQKQHAVQ